MLYSTTRPTIESTINCMLCCYKLSYQGLLSQFELAELPIYNNQWSNIYDFSQTNSYSYLSINTSIEQFINIAYINDYNKEIINDEKKLAVLLTLNQGVIPITTGKTGHLLSTKDQSSPHFILALGLLNANTLMKELYTDIIKQYITIKRCAQVQIDTIKKLSLLTLDTLWYNACLQQKNLIGFEINTHHDIGLKKLKIYN